MRIVIIINLVKLLSQTFIKIFIISFTGNDTSNSSRSWGRDLRTETLDNNRLEQK